MSALNRWLLLVAAAVLTACAGEPITINARLPAGAQLKEARAVSGQACGFQLLLLIPIQINNRHERAYQMLLAAAGSDALTDVSVSESWAWAFAGTVYCTKMHGQAVPVRAVPPPPLPAEPPAAPAAGSAPGIAAPVAAPAATPAAAPSVPAPAVETPAAPVIPAALVAGGKAKVKEGATLRARATPEGDAVNGSGAGTIVTLKVVMNNASGSWWYAYFDGGSGWIRASELEALAP